MSRKEDPLPLPFKTVAAWERWLNTHHQESDGIWMKIAKKASGITSISCNDAILVALCHGWIDGQRKSLDDAYYQQRFTPRRRGSLWSKINVGRIAKLTAEGRMQPAGVAEVDSAKKDGRWNAAYDSPANMVVPDDFLQALKTNKKAKAYFDSLNRSQTYAIGWRLATAKKPETRQRRFDRLFAMLVAEDFR